jgi:hypothetical protein
MISGMIRIVKLTHVPSITDVQGRWTGVERGRLDPEVEKGVLVLGFDEYATNIVLSHH